MHYCYNFSAQQYKILLFFLLYSSIIDVFLFFVCIYVVSLYSRIEGLHSLVCILHLFVGYKAWEPLL